MERVKRALLVFVYIFIVYLVVINLSPHVRQFLISTGILQEKVLIAGTGSMYPTFPQSEAETDIKRAQEVVAWPKMRRYPSGVNFLGVNIFSYNLKRGDIVEIDNEKTAAISQAKYGEQAGFVKRIIATSGDTVELRDGFVYVKGQLLDEPYTAKPRSTYGGDFLSDCKVLEVPAGFVFVMGDNRKASLDSRYELELVSLSDIHFVLPWEDQKEYQSLWRDTKDDFSFAQTATLKPLQFLKLLNEKRKEKNLKPYKHIELLSRSSKRRGDIMIKTNDFSTEASKSGVTLNRSIKESGYKNIIFAEVFTRGFYEAQELLDNFLEFPDTRNILYSSEYQDIGLSPVLGEIDNCPVQTVVAHLGGYVPPNYSKEEKESWENLIKNIEDVYPSWEKLKEVEAVDKNKVNRLLSILQTRLGNAKRILSKITANQWLTDEERQVVDEDAKTGEEAQRIISELKIL